MQQTINKKKYFSGEKLDREDVDVLIKECCDAEDDDGFIPYERKKTIVNLIALCKIFFCKALGTDPKKNFSLSLKVTVPIF